MQHELMSEVYLLLYPNIAITLLLSFLPVNFSWERTVLFITINLLGDGCIWSVI